MSEHSNGGLTEEQTLLVDTIRKFAQETVQPAAAEHDLERTFPEASVAGIAELGLFGLPFPESLGGVDMGFFTQALVTEELAAACASTAMTLVAQTNLALGTLFHGGSPEQHERLGEALAMGESYGALALGAGGFLPGAAVDGVTATKNGDDWTLSGSVPFVLNGGRAGTLFVLATTDAESGAAGMFIVSGDDSGLERGAADHTLGLCAADHCTLTFKDVAVAAADVVGDPAGGKDLTRKVLDHARVQLAAVAAGIARGALDRTVVYSKERKAFGKRLADFGGTMEKLSDMAAEAEGARQLVHAAARQQDAGGDAAPLAAMAQIQAGRAAVDVSYHAVQIFGGYGYCHEYEVERLLRDAKTCEVGIDEMALVRQNLARAVVD